MSVGGQAACPSEGAEVLEFKPGKYGPSNVKLIMNITFQTAANP